MPRVRALDLQDKILLDTVLPVRRFSSVTLAGRNISQLGLMNHE